MLPVAEQAAARRRLQIHATEVAAAHVGQPVVARDALVDEGVVRGQQLEHAAVLAHDAVEEQLGLAPEAVRERRVVRGIQQRVRADLVEVLQPQPLRREARRQGLRARVAQHPLDLSS
jgi:hypothetical protein